MTQIAQNLLRRKTAEEQVERLAKATVGIQGVILHSQCLSSLITMKKKQKKRSGKFKVETVKLQQKIWKRF